MYNGIIMRKINFTCIYCHSEFVSKKSCKSRLPKFCSKKCYGLNLRKRKFCPVCNEHVNWNNKIYCSKKCSTIGKKGKKFTDSHKQALSNAKKGKKPKHLYTPEIINKISNSLKGKPQPWNRGENHPNYIDGGKEKYERQKAMGRVEYKNWRREVFSRDNFTCKICQKKGGRLNADHIKPWALFPENRYDVDNGRTLCVSCHRKTSTWGSVRRKSG